MDSTQTQKLVDLLIAQLEAGTSPWRREWDASCGDHHRNLRSGRRYRGVNPILLTLGMHRRGSSLPYWCGWGEARALGLVPRTGTKAVMVLRPQQHRRLGAARLAEPQTAARDTPFGDALAQPEATTWVSYRPVPLFNASDLVGDALPALLNHRAERVNASRRSEPERLAAAEAVLQSWPVPLDHGSERACYLPVADRIVLPVRSAFHSAAAYYATWAHEAVHSTGHVSRLARDLTGCSTSPSYAREELVAELGSVLLGDRLEIGSDLANHASYLASWINLLKETPRLLLQVLAEARRAADLIAPETPVELRGCHRANPVDAGSPSEPPSTINSGEFNG